eukprot:608625-Hanusia_phi.AAC.1
MTRSLGVHPNVICALIASQDDLENEGNEDEEQIRGRTEQVQLGKRRPGRFKLTHPECPRVSAGKTVTSKAALRLVCQSTGEKYRGDPGTD